MRGRIRAVFVLLLCLILLAGCFAPAAKDPSGEDLQALVGKPLHIPEAEKQGGLYYKLSAGLLRYWLSMPDEHFAYPDTSPEDLLFRIHYTQALIETGVYQGINLLDYEDTTVNGEFMAYKVPKEIFTPLLEAFFEGIEIDEDFLVGRGYMDEQKTAYLLTAGAYGGGAKFTIQTLERLADGTLFVQAWSEKQIADYPNLQLSFIVDDSGEHLRFIKAELDYVYDAQE